MLSGYVCFKCEKKKNTGVYQMSALACSLATPGTLEPSVYAFFVRKSGGFLSPFHRGLRYVTEAVLNVQKCGTAGKDSAGLTPRLTPGAPRTLSRMHSYSSSSGSRPSSSRSTISDLFYDLNIDSPVTKT